MDVKQKIVNAVNSKKLSLKHEGLRNWYNYRIRITKLYWSRNLFDGYKIEVYCVESEYHLETIFLK